MKLSALALGVVFAALPVPAAAADPTPTMVRVSWIGADHQTVRVTWAESVAATSNHIEIEYPDGGSTDTRPDHQVHVGADQPNQYDFAVTDFPTGRELRIGVFVGSPGQPDTSNGGRSAVFDTEPSPYADLTELSVGAGVVRWGWTPRVVHPEATPGDPLDLPQAPATWVPVWNGPQTTGTEDVGPATTATEFSTSDPGGAYAVGVRPIPNEWGTWGVNTRTIASTQLTTSVPSATTWGTSTVITGTVARGSWVCRAVCGMEYGPENSVRLVRLQARRDAASPWYLVSTQHPSGYGDQSGTFRFVAAAPGTRQFRLSVDAVPDYELARSAGPTEPRTTRVVTQVVSAKFADPTVALGAKAGAFLWVRPEGTQRATLQYYSAGAWRSLKWVYLSQGRGGYVFTATRRGTTSYRFVVPATTYSGLGVEGVTTRAFTLTVS